MLEKPDLPEEKIIAALQAEYGVHAVQVTFLPLGNDINTVVYQVIAGDETAYFLKLRRGNFDEPAVAVPKFLGDQGIKQIIAPLATRTGQLWGSLESFKLFLSPFVEGQNGFEVDLSDQHWIEFGSALKRVHTARIPSALAKRLPSESYSPYWRDLVKTFQAQAETQTFEEPVAVKLAALLQARRAEIDHLVKRAEQLGLALQGHSPEFVLCHSDIHAGNLLIGSNESLYLVDWDNPILAPKERDLMFVGGGVGGVWNIPREEALFYQGYGQAEIDPVALAYYRYERIVEDIAAYWDQILLLDEGSEDQEEGLQQLTDQFLPNNVVEIAYRSEAMLPPRS